MSSEPVLPRHYSDAQVKSQYARVAWFYDGWSRLTEDKAMRRLLALAEVDDGQSILEVAVGTGRLFQRLVELNPTGDNQGIDLSPAMLAHARRRMTHSRNSNFQLQEASAFALPFADASFDRVFNVFMLDLMPMEDFPRLLAEYRRVLKPGGQLAIGYFASGEKWFHRLWPWLAKVFPALLTGCRPVAPAAALQQAGFRLLHEALISQNTFPAGIITAEK